MSNYSISQYLNVHASEFPTSGTQSKYCTPKVCCSSINFTPSCNAYLESLSKIKFIRCLMRSRLRPVIYPNYKWSPWKAQYKWLQGHLWFLLAPVGSHRSGCYKSSDPIQGPPQASYNHSQVCVVRFWWSCLQPCFCVQPDDNWCSSWGKQHSCVCCVRVYSTWQLLRSCLR